MKSCAGGCIFSVSIRFQSVLIVHSLYTVGNACQNLIRNGIENIRQDSDWKLIAENDGFIAFLAVDVCDINHAHIHTDVSHVGCLLSVDQAIAMSVAQMTVQAVGISDRNGSDAGIACENSFPAVAYGVVSRHIVNLQDGGLQGGDIVQHLVGKRVDAVESDSQTYHVKPG